MNKRDAVLRLLDPGSKQSYVPAAFFLHFDQEFHSGPAAIAKHEEYFRATGMDFVKIQFELPFPTIEVNSPGGWRNLPCLDLYYYEAQLDVVKGLVERLGHEALVVLTLYSPLMLAGNMGGRDVLRKHLEQDPEPVAIGLKNVTDSLERFCQECLRLGLDGFYHSTQGGEDSRFASKETFEKYVKPTDLRIMRQINDNGRFNILHICDYHRDEFGGYSDLSAFIDYPGDVVNCSLEGRTTKEIAAMFGRPFMGGMDRKGALAFGTEAEARSAARKVLDQRPDRFILGADCTVPGNTPWTNLKAAIDEAHKA